MIRVKFIYNKLHYEHIAGDRERLGFYKKIKKMRNAEMQACRVIRYGGLNGNLHSTISPF